MTNKIGSLNEKPLHAALKSWYAEEGDQFEVPVEGYVIDIVRGELLIEIQTRGFCSLKVKLNRLVRSHALRLVYPIPQEKWIVKVSGDGQSPINRRKSPKRGRTEHVFSELVSFPSLLENPNFSLEVLLIQEEEFRRFDGRRAWRRKGWVTHERRLLRVVDRHRYRTPAEMAALIPRDLGQPFTTSDLAVSLAQPRRIAQQMAYCLREMGVIVRVGKQGNALVYARVGNERAGGQP
jgi:hypothetical protein